jgi:hypothetical protein
MNEKDIEILRDCTLKAIEYLDRNPWDAINNSRKGDLVYNDKLYPTKLVIANVNNQIENNNLDVVIPNLNGGEPIFKFFEKLGFEIRRKTKNKSIHEIIEELLKTQDFLSLINADEYHFSKIYDIRNEFDAYKISTSEIDYIIENYVKNYTTNYENFCDNISDIIIKDFAIIMGKLIAHIDLKASGKNKWNAYIDKRIIANSSVRQTNWVSFFCSLKKDKNFRLNGSIQNAWDYICSPEKNFTILSVNHRKLITENLLNIDFVENDFSNHLINWFSTHHPNMYTKEPKNLTYLISCLIYNKNVMPFWKIDDISYWVFQGNPKIFDFETALKENILTDWTVSAHKDKIKVGDKVILWITGNKSGCYALAEVTSKPKEKKISPDSHLWKGNDSSELKANIKITHNLIDKPLLKEEVSKIVELSELKIGNQGTNFKATQEEYEILLSILENNSFMKENQLKKAPLNQILYGAPGTGKTYSTKKLAIEIIDNKEYLDTTEVERDIILARFNELTLANQIYFTTFHQSMSYEDFIEGIKPIMDGEEEIEISYKIKNGIFKNICSKALQNDNKIALMIDNFDETWDKLIELIKTNISNDKLLKIGSWEYSLSSKESLKYSSLNTPSQYTFTITKQNIFDVFQNKIARPSGAFQKDMLDIIDFMKKHLELNDYNENNHLSISDGVLQKKYVLIIDEINRGNISSIFGELITLLEDDKRKGNKEEIEVVLPYSQDKFSVPQNVFIIGTMNTADRSVESLDTALRRRFSFVEMPSKPEKLINVKLEDAEDIDLVKMLDTINQRIELLIDKDHQIGHSFFINLKNLEELKFVFKNKIIPLLEEYFFGDFGKIGLVLGDRYISVKNENENKGILAKFSAYDDTNFITEKKVYQIKDCNNLEVKDFISIYE